jgi:hypothetical protein
VARVCAFIRTKMCPLRVILLFLSAILAGYFAIKTVRSQAADSILELQEDEQEASAELMENTGTFNNVSAGISAGFWLMVDMLSGRYLYQNLKGQSKGVAEAGR